ncbi:hypothetical protein I79_023456 [Cricetulus griseus]|uniref:Uncharacterized protein n=1 Tax=Cricetulus griseus TaxID=10029 RepID=G3IHZ6_CRIGR|nr:hypothetical protein I79_023456 [Cricetulus griseus]
MPIPSTNLNELSKASPRSPSLQHMFHTERAEVQLETGSHTVCSIYDLPPLAPSMVKTSTYLRSH